MIEDAETRSEKYINSTVESLKRLGKKKNDTTIGQDQVDKVMGLVRGYTKDAKHYLATKKPVTSLACIAYAEGLLDALKFLELLES